MGSAGAFEPAMPQRAHLVVPLGLAGAAVNHVVLSATVDAASPTLFAQRIFAWSVGFAIAAALGRATEVVGGHPAVALFGALPACVLAAALDRFAAGFGPPPDVSFAGAGLAVALAVGPLFAGIARVAADGERARPGSEVGATLRRTKWVVAASAVLAAAAFGGASSWQLALVGMPIYAAVVAAALGAVPALVQLRRLGAMELRPVPPTALGDSYGPRPGPRPRVVDAGVGEGTQAVVLRGGSAYRDASVLETVVRGDPRAAVRALAQSVAIQAASAALGALVTGLTLV